MTFGESTADTNTNPARAAERERRCTGDRVVALAGNPNVGKSTIFNALTGMKQHTGNSDYG